jgi:hypothetical protein
VKHIPILLILVATAVSACGSKVKNQRITAENKDKVFDQIKTTKDLTIEEVGLLQGYIMRKGIGDAFAGKTPELPVGKTIGEIIDEQKKWIADEKVRQEDEKQRVARAKAAEEQQRKRLLDAITVTVFEKGFQHADYQDYVTIRVMYENKSGKDVRGFKGSIQFNDLFGAEIMPFNISEDQPLVAGETKRQGWTLKYNQFIDKHVKLRNTELENMKVEWKPQIILFADGTSMEVKSS